MLSIHSVVPIHYTIFLRCLGRPEKQFAYDGEVIIDLDIKSNTRDIILNTIELKILSAELVSENLEPQKASIGFQDAVQRSTFTFSEAVKGKATLKIQFEGNINSVGSSSSESSVLSLRL